MEELYIVSYSAHAAYELVSVDLGCLVNNSTLQ